MENGFNRLVSLGGADYPTEWKEFIILGVMMESRT